MFRCYIQKQVYGATVYWTNPEKIGDPTFEQE